MIHTLQFSNIICAQNMSEQLPYILESQGVK